jgi:hypothetical protein
MYPKFSREELELLVAAMIVVQHRRLVLAVNSSSLASSISFDRTILRLKARLQPPF